MQGSERKPTPGAVALRGLEISQCQSVRQVMRKAFMRTPWREPAGCVREKGIVRGCSWRLVVGGRIIRRLCDRTVAAILRLKSGQAL